MYNYVDDWIGLVLKIICFLFAGKFWRQGMLKVINFTGKSRTDLLPYARGL